MATGKDIKALMEARKARRAIPQTDPAEVIEAVQEPEGLPAEPAAPATEASPEPAHEAASAPGHTVADPAQEDPRAQPTPADDPYIPTTLRMRSHHREQLKAERYYKGIRMQDVLETALDEYFMKRYGRRG